MRALPRPERPRLSRAEAHQAPVQRSRSVLLIMMQQLCKKCLSARGMSGGETQSGVCPVHKSQGALRERDLERTLS